MMKADNPNSFDLLEKTFSERKDRFIESLEKVLSSVASDKYIQQMFEDKHSALYTPDRICEIIHRIMADDREQIIFDLSRRIKSIEFFFDQNYIHQIEEIGIKQIESKQGKSKDAVNSFCQILNNQINNFDNFGRKNILMNEKIYVSEMKLLIQSIRSYMNSIIKKYHFFLEKSKIDSIQMMQQFGELLKQTYNEKLKKANELISQQSVEINELAMNNLSKDDSIIKQENLILKQKIQNLEKTNSSSFEQIISLQQQLLTLKKDCSQLEFDKKDFLSQIVILKNENGALKNEKIDFQQQIFQYKSEIIKSEKETNESQQQVFQLKDEIAKSEKETNEIQQQIYYLKEGIAKSEKEKKEFQLNNLQLNIEAQQSNEKIELVKNDLLLLSAANKPNNDNIDSISNPNHNETYFSKHDSKINKLKEENNLYLTQINAYLTEIKQLKDSLQEATQIIKQFESKESEIINLMKNNEILTESIQIIKKENRQKLKKRDELVTSLQQKNITLSEKIVYLQNINSNLQMISSKNEKTLDNLRLLTNTLTNSDLIPKITNIYQEKVKICDFLHRSVHSDSYEAIKHYFNILDKLKLILNVSDNEQILPEAQNIVLNTKKMSSNNDLFKALKVSDEKELNSKLKTLLKYNEILEMICSENGVIDSDITSSQEIIQNSIQIVKEISNILNVQSPRLIKSYVLELSNNQKLLNRIKDNLDLSSDDNFERVEKSISSLLTTRNAFENILHSLNLIDETKFQKHIQSLISIRNTFEEICQVLKVFEIKEVKNKVENLINFKKEIENIFNTSNFMIIKRKIEESNQKNNKYDEISKLLNIIENEGDELLLKGTIQSLIKTKEKLDEISNLLINNDFVEDEGDDYNFNIIIQSIEELTSRSQIIENLYSDFKVSNENQLKETILLHANVYSSLSLLCSKYSISQFSEIEPFISALSESKDKLSKICNCFGTDEIEDIISIKSRYDSLQDSFANLGIITGKKNDDEIVNFISNVFEKLKSDSKFIQKLMDFFSNDIKIQNFASSYSPSSSQSNNKLFFPDYGDDFFPLTKERKDNLFSFFSNFKIMEEKRSNILEKIVACGQSLGYVGDINDFDKLFSYVIEAEIEKKTEALINEHKMKIDEQKGLILNLKQRTSKTSENYESEIEKLRESLKTLKEELNNEKISHQELIMILSGKVLDSEFLKSKLSAKEMILLNKAEKTKKFINEMNKKKEESERIISLQKKAREEILPFEISPF